MKVFKNLSERFFCLTPDLPQVHFLLFLLVHPFYQSMPRERHVDNFFYIDIHVYRRSKCTEIVHELVKIYLCMILYTNKW